MTRILNALTFPLRALLAILLFVLIMVLASCAPGATIERTGEGWLLAFANSDNTAAHFTLIVLGDDLYTEDTRCDPQPDGITCNLGVLQSGGTSLVFVQGSRISCGVYRLPVLRRYGCSVLN